MPEQDSCNSGTALVPAWHSLPSLVCHRWQAEDTRGRISPKKDNHGAGRIVVQSVPDHCEWGIQELSSGTTVSGQEILGRDPQRARKYPPDVAGWCRTPDLLGPHVQAKRNSSHADRHREGRVRGRASSSIPLRARRQGSTT